MRRFLCLVVTAFCFFQGCDHPTPTRNRNEGNPAAKPGENDPRLARVKVTRKGQIFLNDQPVTPHQLKRSFAELKQQEGAVLYYREDPEGEPPAEAMAVVQAVIDARLAIRLSAKPDYSDAIGLEGKPIPNQ
jgi:biopolymer transport protein ExbD